MIHRKQAVHPGLVNIALWALVCLVPSVSFADNPIVQTNYTADPAAMVHDGRVYVFTGHDEDVSVNGPYGLFTMNEWRCYSSADMVNWTDHGSPLNYKTFAWSSGDAWASQAIFRNGKFYVYVPITSKDLKKQVIGVAVSDKPMGPYKDALNKPIVSGADCNEIDPTVFIDDDGQAYMYWGNPTACYVKLNEDMISYQGSVVRVPMTKESFGNRLNNTQRTTLYEEGPWFYKHNGTYYLAFAADCCSEKIDYSTSNSPTGPWTYRGRIMTETGNRSFTNHPSIIDFKGKSYLFYHSGALPGGDGYHRSVCIEEFKYNADGTIPSIAMTTEGPSAIANLNPFVRTEAETIAFSSGLKTESCDDTDGGVDVTAINNGDYIKVKRLNFGGGVTTFEARVASQSSGGSIELRLDSVTGTLLGTCAVAGTGGAQTWKTTSCEVGGVTGVHDLFFKFTGNGTGNLFNFNWWKFSGPGEKDNIPDGGADAAADAAVDMALDAPVTGMDLALDQGRSDTAVIPSGTGGVTATGGKVSGTGGVSSGGAGGGSGGSAAGGTTNTSGGAKGGSTSTTQATGGNGGGAGGSSGCSCELGQTSSHGWQFTLLIVIGALLRQGRQRGRSSRTTQR